MKAANLKTSPRLQRVCNLLGDFHWHSSRDIERNADTVAAHTCIDELRDPKNAVEIDHKQEGHTHFYRRIPDFELKMQAAV